MVDEDLERLTRSEMIVEVKKLRVGIRSIATAPDMRCVGTIPNCGNFFRRRSIRIWPCRHGRSSCEVVCGPGSRSILNFRLRRA